LPFAFYQGYLLEHRYGLSHAISGHWLPIRQGHLRRGRARHAAASVVYLALRQWPDTGGGSPAAIFALATIGLARIAPVVLLPIFYKFSRSIVPRSSIG
jgi:STE24 endopeptidase